MKNKTPQQFLTLPLSLNPRIPPIYNETSHKLIIRYSSPTRIFRLDLVKVLPTNPKKCQVFYAPTNYPPLNIPSIKSKKTKISFEATPNTNCDHSFSLS